ncbi:histidine kinase [Paracoccus limosus]|uniref:Histidine kinase n=1 Tax=Paracoccus limosus TaxID=913252 RepID=A0A844H4D5_9RHOB|nr:histidine kinase [Paracoccus limosus]
MNGRIPALILIAAAVAAGVGVWYAQEYGFYDRIDPSAAALTVIADGKPVALATNGVEAIDADSSPIRWRACFHLTKPLPADAEPFAQPTPLIAPGWFSCFDAGRIAADLASGAAHAYLGQPEIRPDVDRVIAVYPDGRAYGWHQFNDKTPERGVMD